MNARRSLASLVLLALAVTGCGTVTVEVTSETDAGKVGVEAGAAPLAPSVTETSAPSTTAVPTTTTEATFGLLGEGSATTTTTATSTTTIAPTTTVAATTSSTTTTTTPIPLEWHQADHAVFARAGDLDVRMPVTRYETVGFHESGHDGAFQLEVVDLADWSTLASRGRDTGSRTAADIVVPIGEPVLSPIDGAVIRAGTYTLYCDHSDNFVVIEPTGRPGWELKIFHFEGLTVGVGDTVVAASTQIGSSGRVLPFESQVDEFTAEPSNPHVHIEVIDTSIPDRPSTGGGC